MSRQKLGQHFLNNPAWQHRILEKLPRAPNDIWIEIGAGLGQMTRHLAQRQNVAGFLGGRSFSSDKKGSEVGALAPEEMQPTASRKRTIAVETDPLLAENLRAQISARPAEWPNVEIAEGDVLSLDLLALARNAGLSETEKFRVYGNLPYYITSPILHHLFQCADRIASIHVVIQLEVAQRVAAKPGTRDYGYLSVACQYYTHPKIALKIPPGAFRPPPKVDSALVAMSLPGRYTTLGIRDDADFLRFVQTCFAHKRKTLRNNLLALAPDVSVRQTMADAGLPPTIRAEELSLEKFAILWRQMRPNAPL
ncbi:MAG: 16S rRNA (adenine(1518)-N(6)/adenine(1519)-N(6))-dimethyltransferase RsmA [Candidatus Acidiferrales bacterium]